jgi:hypothetical protein
MIRKLLTTQKVWHIFYIIYFRALFYININNDAIFTPPRPVVLLSEGGVRFAITT